MAECSKPDDEELNNFLSNFSGKKEELFSDEENEFFSAFEEYFSDDGSEETSSSLTECSSDDEEDCVQLSDSIWMFPDRRISTRGEIYEGELRSGIHDARPIVLKLVANIPQSITEARILAKLNHHSHVLSLIQSDIFNCGFYDQIYIALDKCHDENLREFITNRKNQGFAFNLSRAIDIAKQMVDGVKYIHENRIIHRDIKPDNILFSLDQRLIKIADFGLSQEIESISTEAFEKGQFGTNGFRPPESFGRGIISQKSDIFSLGATLYFVLSNGEHPFGEDPDGWNHHMINGIIDLSGLLVPNIKTTEHLIKSMIKHKINDRPTIWQVSEHPFWTGNEISCDFDYHCPESAVSLIPLTSEKPSYNIDHLYEILKYVDKLKLRDKAASSQVLRRDEDCAEVPTRTLDWGMEEAYRAHLSDDTIYRIDPNRCKGRVLIMNYPMSREESETEIKSCRELWRILGFDTQVLDYSTSEELSNTCEKFLAETKDASVVVIIAMVHIVMQQNFILCLFDTDKFPHLQGVPKVLLFHDREFAVGWRAYFRNAKLFRDSIAQIPDVLLVYSWHVYQKSSEVIKKNSFFDNLTNVIKEHGHDTHFEDMLEVAKRGSDSSWFFRSFLKKKLYLFPDWHKKVGMK